MGRRSEMSPAAGDVASKSGSCHQLRAYLPAPVWPLVALTPK